MQSSRPRRAVARDGPRRASARAGSCSATVYGAAAGHQAGARSEPEPSQLGQHPLRIIDHPLRQQLVDQPDEGSRRRGKGGVRIGGSRRLSCIRTWEVLPGELWLPDSFRAVRGLRGAGRQVGSAGGLVGGRFDGAAAPSVATSCHPDCPEAAASISGAALPG